MQIWDGCCQQNTTIAASSDGLMKVGFPKAGFVGFRGNPKTLDVTDAPCWIRTNDRLLRRQLLYPAELREQTLQSCQ